ncbi:MAG: pyridoxal phosphate-dependent aminotransferase [Eubacterium sp.]|nr:pyridoxal phosphate-dependent aminotransferase [Eubacterium sp.]
MKYDFDTPIDRRGTNSLKWDIAENELPMWVADMDFQTAPEIREAILKRAEHGVFGYSVVPDEWYQAYADWWDRRHGLKMERENLFFCTGVIPAISSVVRRLTHPAENVVVMSPVYNIFYNCILNNGRNVLENVLSYDGNEYSINFDDLENKLAEPQTSLLLLCNPHNPVGRIWDKETLARIGELCGRYNVLVLSDEIHCDLTDPGKEYVPFASVSDVCRRISVTCIAPTKAFNLAGLQTSAVYVGDSTLRQRVMRGLNNDEVAEPNAFAVQAAVAAFTKGGGWLDELRQYLFDNKALVKEFIAENIPQIKLVPSEATYLLWLDCSELSEGGLAQFIRSKTGLFVSAGASYGKGGDGFLRLNVACPRGTLKDGLERLKNGIEMYINKS